MHADPDSSMVTLKGAVGRVKQWLKRFASVPEGDGSVPLEVAEPGGAGSSSSDTLVEVPSSSNSPLSSQEVPQQQPVEQHSSAPQQAGQAAAQAHTRDETKVAPTKQATPDTRDFFAEYGEANRYIIREVIGKGSYGVVCSATDQFTGERVAIKKITNVFEHVSDATRILREIKLLRMLKHPDIVEIKHIMLPPSAKSFKDIYVVFELMETDLHQVIKANDDLTPDHHQFFLYQMLRGLKYIHSAKVFHRDLKPKNILANSDCKLKICDFGLARPAFNDVPTAILWTDYVATRWYRAPELCGSFFAKYSPAIDIWSVGCIFAEVLLGKPLFPGKNVAHQLEIITDLLGTPAPHVLDKVRNEKARRFLMSMRPKPGIPFKAFFPRAAPGALALLQRMLAFDPADRPSAEEALADPYFAGLHSPSREPAAQPISKMAFEFDRRKLEMADVRELIYREILEYHPQVLRAHMGHGSRSGFVNPSSLDNFKRQFLHLEQNPGAVLDIRNGNPVVGPPGSNQAGFYQQVPVDQGVTAMEHEGGRDQHQQAGSRQQQQQAASQQALMDTLCAQLTEQQCSSLNNNSQYGAVPLQQASAAAAAAAAAAQGVLVVQRAGHGHVQGQHHHHVSHHAHHQVAYMPAGAAAPAPGVQYHVQYHVAAQQQLQHPVPAPAHHHMQMHHYQQPAQPQALYPPPQRQHQQPPQQQQMYATQAANAGGSMVLLPPSQPAMQQHHHHHHHMTASMPGWDLPAPMQQPQQQQLLPRQSRPSGGGKEHRHLQSQLSAPMPAMAHDFLSTFTTTTTTTSSQDARLGQQGGGAAADQHAQVAPMLLDDAALVPGYTHTAQGGNSASSQGSSHATLTSMEAHVAGLAYTHAAGHGLGAVPSAASGRQISAHEQYQLVPQQGAAHHMQGTSRGF